MKKIVLILTLALTFGFTASAQILDGSFEEGDGAGTWVEASTNFGTPICNEAACGDCGGPCLPYEGDYYVWFGGANAEETGSVQQSAVFPAGTAGTLLMLVKMPANSGLEEDRMEVSIDGEILETITTADSTTYQEEYALLELDVTNYADGGTHDLKIEGFQTTSTITNILVDEVTLIVDGQTSTFFPELLAEEGVFLYPTQADNVVNLEFRDIKGEATISITNVSGAVVASEVIDNVAGRTLAYNTSQLDNGMYFVNVATKDGVITKKMMVRH